VSSQRPVAEDYALEDQDTEPGLFNGDRAKLGVACSQRGGKAEETVGVYVTLDLWLFSETRFSD